MKLEKVYTVRIVYKSGYTHDFECTEFTYTKDKVTWKSAGKDNYPIYIGLDEIAAVYQLKFRTRILWSI